MRGSLPRVCAVALAVAAAAAPAHAESIDLPSALERANSHPNIVSAEQLVRAARGERVDASTIAHNPELELSGGPRTGAGVSATDVEVGLWQTFELGGKRSKRTAVADARVDVAEAELARTRQLVFWRVREAFAHALIARERLRAAREGEDVALELLALTRERLAQGKGTKLEVNQAIAEVGRARRDRLAAEQGYEAACFELSSAVGVDGAVKLEPTGALDELPADLGAEDDLVTRALANRPDLLALRHERRAADAGRAYQDSLRVPDLAVGATYAREEGVDVFLVGVSMELPLWNRHQGQRQTARALASRARVVEDYGRSEIERQVRVAYRRYVKARAAVEAFDTAALGTLRENLQLTRESFESGKLSIVEFAVLRSSFVEVQLAYLDAVDEQVEAYYALQIALGNEGGPR